MAYLLLTMLAFFIGVIFGDLNADYKKEKAASAGTPTAKRRFTIW
jgi:hypothetical protein